MSDHSVTCTINNGLTGNISLASADPNSGTGWSNNSNSSVIAPNASGGFTATGGSMSGCGGTVTYTLPNGDTLLFLYNTSVNYGNAYCVALLQSGSGNLGTDAYFCSPSNVVSTDDNSISVSVNIWEM